MNFEVLPERRAFRRVVFVVDQKTIDSLETDPTARDLLLREDAAVLLATTDPDHADPVTRLLEAQGLLSPGSVLVLSPYRDGGYAPIEDAMDRFSLQKWTALSTLCAYLGARSLTVQVIEDTESESRATFGVDVGRGPVKVSGKGGVKHLENLAAQMDLNDEYLGAAWDLERANEYLATSGLGAEPEVASLVDARSFPGNMLSKRTLRVDLSRESERTIDAALAIKVPTVLDIGAKFQHVSKNKAHYRVTVEVNFSHEGNLASGGAE